MGTPRRTSRRVRLGLTAGVLALVGTACPTVLGAPDPTIGNCPMMPADNYWHADVSKLPVHPRSDAWVSSLGSTAKFHTDFGAGTWQGAPIGFPYTVVGGGEAKVPISFTYPQDSDAGPYPLPYDAPVEGGPSSNGDRHVIVVDSSTCKLYEVFAARRGDSPSAPWTAGSGAVFDLRSNAMRPDTHTSADAAGLPMLPGLVRYEEVASGRIDHAIRFTANRTSRAYLWPAKHFASDITDPNVPPMGAWFRLRADYPTDGLAPQAKVIVEAMKVHGIILADNGSSWFMSGTPDERWDNQALAQVWRITGADMQAVDTSSLIVDPNSGQTTQGRDAIARLAAAVAAQQKAPAAAKKKVCRTVKLASGKRVRRCS